MTSSSTLVQYFPSAATDASFSKNYLTKRNYRGQRLLRTVGSAPVPHVNHKPEHTTSPATNMAAQTDDDIMALPMSSDEEEQSPKPAEDRADTTPTSKRKNEDASAAPNKRVKAERKGIRSSKRVAEKPGPQPQPQPQPEATVTVPDLPAFLSQSSQQRRAKTYGRTNSFNMSSSQNSKLADPGAAPLTPRKTQTKSFNAPDEIQRSRKRSTPQKKIKDMDIPSSTKKSRGVPAAFQMPDEGLPNSSSVSTGLSDIFDAGDSPELSTRKRSGSTSSLSSLDSLASYELSQKQKHDLSTGETTHQPIPPGHIQCPLCQDIINPAKLPLEPAFTSTTKPTNLSLRLQQKFCHTHRLHSAHLTWKSRSYPTIDWDHLESKRISTHIPHLRQILYRKTPSYYLTHLDTTLQSFRSNQSKIRKYMAHDIVDFVKTGYYGPRGAKVMGDHITTDLANHLKRSVKADKTVRAVGVAGFVSAVLIPELLVRLVVEDMELAEDEGEDDGPHGQARKIIDESNEIGVLVWPDDDHVEDPGEDGL